LLKSVSHFTKKEGADMRASTKNLMWGRFHIMKGSLRVTLGNTFNRRWTSFSGRVERTGGFVQSNFGRMERVCGW
jgi:hypothetical protein